MTEQQRGAKVAERLSRQENRARTRARLLTVGRRHFLTRGYSDTVLEQVAEEAGFSRGAMYSNFSGKEELFLAVFENDLQAHVAKYHEVLDSDMAPEHRIAALRKAYIAHATNRAWGVLRTEFEHAALRSETLRKRFAQVYRRDVENSVELVHKAIGKGDLALDLPPDHFVMTSQSFMLGLLLKQRLLGEDSIPGKAREIAGMFFDNFIAPHLKRGAIHQRAAGPRPESPQ